MLLWKVLLAGWELREGVYVQYWLLCLEIFLCHSAVCSAAARMLFSGGKGTFLAHALYRPAWCHFRGRSEVKDHQGTSGAMGLHGNTVSNQKNSCVAVWKLHTWKNAPNEKVLKTPLRISGSWAGCPFLCNTQSTEGHPSLWDCNKWLILPGPSQKDVHMAIYSLGMVHTAYACSKWLLTWGTDCPRFHLHPT